MPYTKELYKKNIKLNEIIGLIWQDQQYKPEQKARCNLKGSMMLSCIKSQNASQMKAWEITNIFFLM